MGAAQLTDLETLRRYYDAWNAAGIDGARTYWTDDFEWHDAPDMPGAGIYKGPDAVAAHFRELVETLGDMQVQVLELVDAGEEALAILDVRLAGSSSGVSIEGPIYEAVRMSDGKLSRIRLFLDREQMLKAVGLEQWPARA